MVRHLTKEELSEKLKNIARKCSSSEEVQRMVNVELPGIVVTVSYHQTMFMGMAMSHYHKGCISF